MAEMTGMLPESLTVQLDHCGKPMRCVGSGATWEGDYEITNARYACGCGLRVLVESHEPSPTPTPATSATDTTGAGA